MKCEYCCNQEAKYQLKNGKRCCCDFSNKCIAVRRKNSNKLKERWKKDKSTMGFYGKTPKLKGKSYSDIYGSSKAKNVSNKISSSLKKLKLTGKAKTEEEEIARRKRISSTARQRGTIGGYRKGSGRGKQGWYKGIWCDSSWELAWVIYHLDHNIPFKRNKKKFKYKYNNKERNWIPDFFLTEEDIFEEVKGYMNRQTYAKIKDFPHKLRIISKKEMIPIFEYVENKYGKDYVKLYGGVSELGLW